MKPHVRSLIGLIKEHTPDPKRGAEIGVWRGHTSAELGKAFPECHLDLVDLWKAWEPGSVYYDKHQVMGRLTQAEWDVIHSEALHIVGETGVGHSIHYGSSLSVAPHVADGILDFVFLDANHMYPDVKADILAWAPKVRAGGLVAGHDYGGVHDNRGLWGISKAVHEVFGKENVLVRPGLIWAVVKK